MLQALKYTFVGIFAIAATVSMPAFAAEPSTETRAADTVAIQQLIVKYAHVYDSLDVEGYVSVFAEDAEFSFPGNTLKGRGEIRKFIEGAKQRREAAAAAGPVNTGYHSISNTLIEFDSADTAHHRSYWQVLSGPTGGPFTVSNMGYYDDVVVKRNGQWLIHRRTIP